MSYIPHVNDYVKWTASLNKVIEGWVYFRCEDYITIEVSVKPKSDDIMPRHKMCHCLVLCYNHNWNELEYIKSREL
jgi:hypothetical protein